LSLLELEHVSKRYGRDWRGCVALRDVSLELDAGELVVVWGLRRSGRSTLLRVAAGVEPADEGGVRFDGRELTGRGGDALHDEIGYCRTTFRPSEGRVVLDQLIAGQIGRGVSPAVAATRARSALARAGAERCATRRPRELDAAEAARVAIARALVHQPRLIVIDEPTLGVDLLVRDAILLLLRSLADEGIAILASTGESTGLSGADRAMTVGDGELHGSLSPELASVHHLHAPAGSSATA